MIEGRAVADAARRGLGATVIYAFEPDLASRMIGFTGEMAMGVQQQIRAYLDAQAEPKRRDLLELHQAILALQPGAQLWFLDGRDAQGKVVSNPNIGYGLRTITYADGKTREFYQIGLSANTTGISVYILGIDDKAYLAQTYGQDLGKATVTGYCIKFKSLQAIHLQVLMAAIQDGLARTAAQP